MIHTMDGQQNPAQAPKKSQTGPIIAIVGLIVIIVVGVVVAQGLNKPQSATQNATQQTAEQTQNTTAETPNNAMVKESAYKDGTYTAVGNYTSPGGPEELGVTLTIANGVVTDSTVEVKATRPMSKTKQTDFAEHYKEQVVGKNIDEITLTKVSGSSLSPKGFNDAVEKIKTEAKA